MMKIKELFQMDIHRRIEEVIKVDQADQETVRNELEEYIVTDSIKGHYRQVLDAYTTARTTPTEGIGVWVSGFFGSGKSSFAKNLGYILANREVLDRKAADIFAAQVNDPRIVDLLKVVNTTIPTHAVIFDVSMDRGIRTASERITEVMYKALLRELGYVEDFDLADLEMGLEADGLLGDFEKRFEARFKQPWKKRRKIGRSLNEASAVLQEMDPTTYPQADSWVHSLGVLDVDGNFKGRADISANRLAELAFELMARRQPGKALVFVIDEVGQYVSRSVDKMLDLQAIVQAFGKEGKNRVKAKKAIAPAWIVVTSQEKLNEVVDALDSKKIELARLQDRFPIRIDLAPADIAEITTRRVLQKKSQFRETLKDLYRQNEGRLASCTRFERTSRSATLEEEAFINIYPYLPYQIDLCIDIMSGIRLQPGAQRHIGGSNRTIIKQAQEMLISEKVNLGNETVGALVSLDKVYDLVDGNLSTERRKDIYDISKTFPDKPFYVKAAKAVCLLEFVRDLPRTLQNIAAVLYGRIGDPGATEEVKEAMEALEKAQFVRQSLDGYKLQTAQEKNWETTRTGLAAKPKDRNQITREILNEIFSDHRVSAYRYKNLRNFRIGAMVDGERLTDEGDFLIHLMTADGEEEYKGRAKETRDLSREDAGKNALFWVAALSDDIHEQIQELHRSKEMISIHERIAAQNKLTLEESSCLSDEKTRRDNIHRELRKKMIAVLQNGTAYFRGVEKDVSALGKELPDMAKGLFDLAVPDLYTKLEMGARTLTGKEAEQVLTATNLAGLPAVYYDGPEGLSLIVKQGAKYVPNPSAEIAREIYDYLHSMFKYGEKVTGKGLEGHFGGIGYGWERDMIRLVLAVLLRAGLIEVTHQGQKFSDHNNPTCRQPFINNNAFKAAAFVPYISDVTLKVLTEAAKYYEAVTGEEVNVEKGTIAIAFRTVVAKDREALLPLKATVEALALPCREFLTEQMEWLSGVQQCNVDECVKTLASEGKTWLDVRSRIKKIVQVLTDDRIGQIKQARTTLQQKYPVIRDLPDLPEELRQAAEELKAILNSETFYEHLGEMTNHEQAISRFYEERYGDLHGRRLAAVTESIEFVKGHLDWGNLPEESRKSILYPLAQKQCEDMAMMGAACVCDHCHSPYPQMESDLVTVDSLRKNAIQKIEELIKPEVKIERLRVSQYVTASIETEGELNEAIEKIRETALKIISAGKRVLFD